MRTVKILFKYSLILLASSLILCAHAAEDKTVTTRATPDPLGQALYDGRPHSLMYYYGQTVNGALLGTFVGNYKHWPEHIQSLEYAYTLSPHNAFRNFFSPIVGVVQLAANGTIRQGWNEHVIYEFDPYIIFRWANLPWNHYVTTSFALAEGVSYDSSIASIERRDNDNTRRLLNYLMFEVTLASPNLPELQFVLRVHHRSGAYGLYRAGNTGSNDIGAGVRLLF